ncbi:MAG TPA: ATP-binding protein [Syntrophales bacterium]|jgi:anti-sigma regulatory factor (Ser/Thr protein kinase)|nr:ATP-binding protein [Syntrophales bacterium]HOU52236.1 ATP-binding protein [Smithella sp.]HPC33935.1 ATP-binding protein [Syntrophales bacterium]HQG35469.1 ATP-binding protein [Syntrophales bacterium]HQI36886.1 ATP-binding protein [Syntrophales bacterium]
MESPTSLVVPAEIASLKQAIDFVSRKIEHAGFELKRIREIELCVEEVLVNIFQYAYPGSIGNVVITCHPKKDGTFVIEIQDTGIPFNILSVDEPDIKASIDERHIGGLGIFFVRQLIDRVEYRREEDKNILSLLIDIPGRQKDRDEKTG